MHVLDNPAWASLTSLQSHLALGNDRAKRYPAHLAPIGGLGIADSGSVDELVALVPEGDSLTLVATLENVAPLLPPTCRVILQKALVQMVWDNPRAGTNADVEMSALGSADVPEMLALTSLTHPGPFRADTYTFGTYLGVRIGRQLAAMAGQRMHLPGYREISAVCTHPTFEGRGYARALVSRLAAMIADEGDVPFLHVEDGNVRAQSMYSKLGFVERRRLPLVVFERIA